MKDIIENNKLIAEFMGLRTTQAAPLRGGEYRTIYNIETLPAINIPVGSHGIHATIGTRLLWANPEQLVFHKSFDWLIPVMQKIYMTATSMPKEYYNVTHIYAVSPIEDMYKVVIQFINWHNANN